MNSAEQIVTHDSLRIVSVPLVKSIRSKHSPNRLCIV